MFLIVHTQSEVTVINKQRFLPELGKLLTFMVEDDRQTALAMYSRLFDDAEDEQKLMDLLVSPTRQAVVIARTYDAKARKQQLESGSAVDLNETPAFVLAIDKIYQQVAPEHAAAPEEEVEPAALINQFSLFADDVHPIDDSEYVPFQIEAEAVPIEEPVEELPVEAAPEESVQEASVQEEAEPAPDAPAEAAEPAEEEETEEPAASAVPEEPEEPVGIVLPEVRTAPAAEAPIVSVPEEAPVSSLETVELSDFSEPKMKARVFPLILYVLFAVPLTLVGVLLLLIPTVLALALAVGVIAGGAFLFMSAFSGFPKLADILIVLGTAVIVLALGLLLLWLFVWFIGGAIVGLVRGVIRLGRKWCYKEVQG